MEQIQIMKKLGYISMSYRRLIIKIRKKMEAPRIFRRIVDKSMVTFLCESENLVIKVKQHDNFTVPNSFIHKKNERCNKNVNQASQQQNSALKTEPASERKIYEGFFSYESLPHECKLWFENVMQIYDALQDQETTEISVRESGLEVKLKIFSEKKGEKVAKACRFFLKLQEKLQLQPARKSSYIILDEDESQMICENVNEKNQSSSVEPEKGKIDISLEMKNFKKIQNTVVKLDLQMKELSKKIQQKWAFICKEIDSLKNKDEQNNTKIQNLFFRSKVCLDNILWMQHPKQQVVIMNLRYRFSENKKNMHVKIISPKIIKCLANDTFHKITLVEPVNYFMRSSHLAQIFSLVLQITNISNYVAVGMCDRHKVEKMGYRCSQEKTHNHGSYILDWAGESWSSYYPADIKYNQNLKFRKGDTIHLEFNTGTRKLKFIRNKNEGELDIDVDPTLPVENLSFCVYICGEGDEVRILENQLLPEPPIQDKFQIVINNDERIPKIPQQPFQIVPRDGTSKK